MVDKLMGMIKPDDAGCLSGGQLQPVMLKAQPPLDKSQLGALWNMADDGKVGPLSPNCFRRTKEEQDPSVAAIACMSFLRGGLILTRVRHRRPES